MDKMVKMDEMPVKLSVEMGGYETGNVSLLLHEIRHALKRLLDTGETTTIDLRSLPFAPGEIDRLITFLGKGEISVHLNALGESEISETSFSGVWVIIHYNSNKEVMGKFIEVAHMPSIAEAQTPDVEDALSSLQTKLENFE